jgi:voltage-gated potassium channel
MARLTVKLKKREKQQIILLALILLYVFVLSLFPPSVMRQVFYSLVLTGIFIITVFALKKGSRFFFYFIGILILLNWTSDFYQLAVIQWLTPSLTLLFFVLAIVFSMLRIAQSKKAGTLEFLEAINVYFLLGILGSILFGIVNRISPGAIRFPEGIVATRSDYIYYSFVTTTTLGYGDVIPLSPPAKIISVFLSVGGQLYLAMVVALLVGKYISAKTKK